MTDHALPHADSRTDNATRPTSGWWILPMAALGLVFWAWVAVLFIRLI